MILPIAIWLFAISIGVSQTNSRRDSMARQPVAVPAPGEHALRILTPTLLELSLVESGAEKQSRFVFSPESRAPKPEEFKVIAGSKELPVRRAGYKQRVIYAPLKSYDLRVGKWLYLELGETIPENAVVRVDRPGRAWSYTNFLARYQLDRWSPIIHVNQAGYIQDQPKTAFAGYYLGTLGELEVPAKAFRLLEKATGKEVYKGELRPTKDAGFPTSVYQRVLEADFTSFNRSGEFMLEVPGLGRSYPFYVDPGMAGAFARAFALGVYHQRCGDENAMPFTRFTHLACHTNAAEVPDMTEKHEATNYELERETDNFKDNPRHRAPRLQNVKSSLYPFVRSNAVAVHGGHHDAGDYSKYTINSAGFVHHLMFAADTFPGVSKLDNLGLPESGDGVGDVLQIAKWEADFLSRMQDLDGGFYFLVYPRGRAYENDVTPDKGDPQVVWPKTTSVTAAAVAALAQCASSPAFKSAFPAESSNYLAKARLGWEFLQRALAKHGGDGAYQKITHYGDEFIHDDELAWAACELFLATGDPEIHSHLKELLNPSDPAIRKWGWWRLYDAYGAAVRSYAFGIQSGRLKAETMDELLLDKCRMEVVAAGEDQLKRSEASAYGVSFPLETKRARSAGWFFPGDAAFDLAAACQIDYPEKRDPRPKMIRAILSNLNYECGANPVNISFVTGLGWRWQREIVHQHAQNDRRISPMSGIPLGAIQQGMLWLDLYKDEPAKLSWPADDSEYAPYPFYDRWGDTFNLSQEFVILNQARSLGYTAWLMAQSPVAKQPWKPTPAHVSFTEVTNSNRRALAAELSANGLPLDKARITWEYQGEEPVIAQTAVLSPPRLGYRWLEAEAWLPDGRRVFAVTNTPARN